MVLLNIQMKIRRLKRICISSGILLDGCQMKIVDDNRITLPDDTLGEIAVKSVSLFDGYRNYPEKNRSSYG